MSVLKNDIHNIFNCVRFDCDKSNKTRAIGYSDASSPAYAKPEAKKMNENLEKTLYILKKYMKFRKRSGADHPVTGRWKPSKSPYMITKEGISPYMEAS